MDHSKYIMSSENFLKRYVLEKNNDIPHPTVMSKGERVLDRHRRTILKHIWPNMKGYSRAECLRLFYEGCYTRHFSQTGMLEVDGAHIFFVGAADGHYKDKIYDGGNTLVVDGTKLRRNDFNHFNTCPHKPLERVYVFWGPDDCRRFMGVYTMRSMHNKKNKRTGNPCKPKKRLKTGGP